MAVVFCRCLPKALEGSVFPDFPHTSYPTRPVDVALVLTTSNHLHWDHLTKAVPFLVGYNSRLQIASLLLHFPLQSTSTQAVWVIFTKDESDLFTLQCFLPYLEYQVFPAAFCAWPHLIPACLTNASSYCSLCYSPLFKSLIHPLFYFLN